MTEAPDFVVDGGTYLNPPPCLRLSKFYKLCETSSVCKLTGGLGPPGLQLYRVPIMYAAAAVSFISIILCIVPLVSFATDADTVRNVHWTHAKGRTFVGDVRVDSFDVYISLRAIALFGFQDTDPTVFDFEDDDCDEELFPYCDDCIESSEDTESVVILAFLTTILQLVQDLQRSSFAGDFNCQRFLGIVFGIVGAFSTLQSIRS
uniref:Uncharacterized protein n=1 Tax=Pinguiococcus pyrenoidosus TaxID=172671 RepID=A0A7R9U6N9_9STRA|mmetsp:Transcript_16846/g.64152  ORF Transcript_16846/g.64152 Transcript_16846/m.64152 type:complete len:205 (+) Transcript_16846:181-795(+)